MSRHSFDPKIADQVGLNAAVIYQNIIWWCEKNRANGENEHGGRYWTYNSIKAFCELFPYLTESQIRTALDKLESEGLILSGNFNKSAYDRTKWFCPVAQIHLGKNTNGIVKDHEPIPDSKPDSKPDITPSPTGSGDVSPAKGSEDDAQSPDDAPLSDPFERFWEAYPRCPRKTDKPKAREAFWRIVQGRHKTIPRTDPDDIIAGATARRGMSDDPAFYPLPTTWLNGARWQKDESPANARMASGMPIGWQVFR